MRDFTPREANLWFKKHLCPLCGKKTCRLSEGPCGGMMQNLYMECGGAINVSPPGLLMIGEVIQEPVGHVPLVSWFGRLRQVLGFK